jgi:dTMP kinase
MDMPFHQRLRQAFLDIAKNEPARFLVVDGRQPPDQLATSIWAEVCKRFGLVVQTTASKAPA